MAGVKISALPAVAVPQLTDIFPIVQSGVTYKETVTQLSTLISSTLSGTFVPIAGGIMTGPLILSQDPTLPLMAATKEYVDQFAAGITVILAAEAATTPAGGDLGGVYFNGVAGVGATITNAGAMVAFAVDGYSANLNDRILVKDQTNSFENGVYSVTTVGSGIANWVLTRTTDYDLAPAQIKPGTLVAVNNGTVNATTSWLETATVTNIGIDPILFSQFTFSPSSFLLRANNLSDLTNVPAALVNLGLGVPTGTGNVVLQTSPTLITPNIGVATATSLAFNPTTNGIIGTTTNNNAGPGFVGEYVVSTVLKGAGVAALNGIAKDITTISLTPGDWIVYGGAGASPTNLLSGFQVWISLVSATIPNTALTEGFQNVVAAQHSYIGFSAQPLRVSINVPTTVYLSVLINFPVGTSEAYGKLFALRTR